jgi:cytochrome c551/c552
MQRTLIALAAVASFAAAGTASAATNAEVFNSKGCGTCHAADAKKMGPSLKDISKKYGPEAADKLTALLAGGKGHPKVTGSDAEIKQAVIYTLTGK